MKTKLIVIVALGLLAGCATNQNADRAPVRCPIDGLTVEPVTHFETEKPEYFTKNGVRYHNRKYQCYKGHEFWTCNPVK